MNQREAATRKIFKEKEFFNNLSLEIGGLNAVFVDLFRRAFSYRILPPYLRDRSSSDFFFNQFLTVIIAMCVPLKFILLILQTWKKAGERGASLWTSRYWQDLDGPPNWKNAKWKGAEGIVLIYFYTYLMELFCWISSRSIHVLKAFVYLFLT